MCDYRKNILSLLYYKPKLNNMNDTIAGLAGTIGAGVVQVVETTGLAPVDVSQDTAISGLISLVVGVVSMLLSRFLNKLALKKKVKQG